MLLCQYIATCRKECRSCVALRSSHSPVTPPPPSRPPRPPRPPPSPIHPPTQSNPIQLNPSPPTHTHTHAHTKNIAHYHRTDSKLARTLLPPRSAPRPAQPPPPPPPQGSVGLVILERPRPALAPRPPHSALIRRRETRRRRRRGPSLSPSLRSSRVPPRQRSLAARLRLKVKQSGSLVSYMQMRLQMV